MIIDRRKKITFMQLEISQNDYGENQDTWVNAYENIWSSKEPILGKEFFAGLTNDTRVDVKFNIRYIDGIDNSMRIKHENDIYDIVSAINIKSLNRELLCYCRLVKP